MAEELLIDHASDVLHLTLNRPERGNALSPSLVETLLSTLDCFAATTRLVVLRGHGRNFCTGFDLGDLDSISDAELLARLVRIETLLQRVCHLPVPILALAHGRVFGAGADLFCASSRRVAAPGATFQMPGWRFGVALGTRRLAQRVGAETARAILIESEVFDTDAALAIGFAQRALPVEQWMDAVAEAKHSALGLEPAAIADLLALTTQDTRHDDMAALVETASRPGLKKRIQAYREEVQRARH